MNESNTMWSANQFRRATAAVSQLSPAPLGLRNRPFSRSHRTDHEWFSASSRSTESTFIWSRMNAVPRKLPK